MMKFSALLLAAALVLGLAGCGDGDDGNGGGSSGGGGKSPGAAVSAPTLNSINSNSITINAATFTAGNPGSQTIEYGRNTSNTAPTSWQDGVTFSGLNANTTYYIFARSKENTTYNAGTPSTGLSVTTDPEYDPNRVSTPITNTSAGEVLYGTEVRLGTTTIGATIYYSTDGNDPTIFSPVFSDSSPIIIKVPTTIKAIAMANGMTVSAVMTATYTVTPYNLGDTGPGGGKIFAVSTSGFTMTDTGETCYYLEAAPANMPTTLAWASSAFIPPGWGGTGDWTNIATADGLGSGRKNTALILAIDANAPAARACSDYTNNGKSDWFLPSRVELSSLYYNRTYVGNMGTSDYWSSSQHSYPNQAEQFSAASDMSFVNGYANQGDIHKFITKYVRAVRAF